MFSYPVGQVSIFFFLSQAFNKHFISDEWRLGVDGSVLHIRFSVSKIFVCICPFPFHFEYFMVLVIFA